jgi:hypothetical protein
MRSSAASRGRRAGGILAAFALLLLGLTACQGFTEVPVLSDRKAKTNATLGELRAWVAAEIEAVMETTGVRSEWIALGSSEDIMWTEEPERIFEGQGLSACSFRPGQVDPAAVRIDLITEPLAQDPFPLLERVRTLWTDRGWEVRNLFEPGQSESNSLDIVAERQDGAMMIFGASDQAGGKLLSLMVESACSNDPSVAQ